MANKKAIVFGAGMTRVREEWWERLERDWPQLLRIMERFLPLDSSVDLINDPGSIDIRNVPSDQILRERIEELKEAQDPKLIFYMNAAWWFAPDDPGIHLIPKWGAMCDLLSDEPIFHGA